MDAEDAKSFVRHHHKDAICVYNRRQDTRQVYSEPGGIVVGVGSTRTRAWKDAAAAIKRSLKGGVPEFAHKSASMTQSLKSDEHTWKPRLHAPVRKIVIPEKRNE